MWKPNDDESLHQRLQELRLQALDHQRAFENLQPLPRVVQAQIRRITLKLSRIDVALKRWQQDQYGRCQSCLNWISRDRLVALPYAELCLECQQIQEKERAYELKHL